MEKFNSSLRHLHPRCIWARTEKRPRFWARLTGVGEEATRYCHWLTTTNPP
jgi:hypothetical protein